MSFVCAISGYFAAGMGITEAIKFHESKLELDDKFSESLLADGRVNPKYRTVLKWHTSWRADHFGHGSGTDMLAVRNVLHFIRLIEASNRGGM